jgi:enoyl-CoA hydratase/carnithine racemase
VIGLFKTELIKPNGPWGTAEQVELATLEYVDWYFIKAGLVPELASTHLLVQRIGIGRASEFALSGRMMQASKAAAVGLADRVVQQDALLSDSIELAAAIAANPAPQLLMTKQLLTLNGSATDLALVQQRESRMLRRCWASPEHAEAVAAFQEKTLPRSFRRGRLPSNVERHDRSGKPVRI